MGKGEIQRSILIVEDEALLAFMLEDLLLDSGYQVTRTTGLRDALELVQNARFDAAILDVNLGGVEVFPLATRLQELQIPFVFASAGDAAVINARFAQHPMIAKPYTIEQIHRSLREIMSAVPHAASS